MRARRLLVITCVIFSSGLSLIGCTSNDISDKSTSQSTIKLDFLVIPEQIIVHDTELIRLLDEVEDKAKTNIKAMKEKYSDLAKISEEDIRVQNEIAEEIQKIWKSGKVIESNKDIEGIINQLRDVEGSFIESFETENIIAIFYLNDDKETPFYVNVDNSYYRQIMLLQDGYIIIPKPIKTSSEMKVQTTYISAKISDELAYELEKLTK